MITMRDPHTKINFCSSRSEYLPPVADRFNADGHQRSLDRRNAGAEFHLDPVRIIGYDHRPGEPGGVGRDPAWITNPIGDYAKRSTHGEHAMRNDTGQPSLLG